MVSPLVLRSDSCFAEWQRVTMVRRPTPALRRGQADFSVSG